MELEQLGWNALTVCFFGTIITTVLRLFGAGHQAWSIWRLRSVRSVSGLNLVSYSFSMVVTAIYGHWIDSLAMVITSAMSLAVTLPSLAGFFRFERQRKKEMVRAIGLAVILAVIVAGMAAAPDKNPFYYGFAVGGMFFASHQPWKIWHNRDAGVVDPLLLGVTLASSVFWLVYWLAVGNRPALVAISAVFTVIALVAMVLWIIYRPRHRSA